MQTNQAANQAANLVIVCFVSLPCQQSRSFPEPFVIVHAQLCQAKPGKQNNVRVFAIILQACLTVWSLDADISCVQRVTPGCRPTHGSFIVLIRNFLHGRDVVPFDILVLAVWRALQRIFSFAFPAFAWSATAPITCAFFCFLLQFSDLSAPVGALFSALFMLHDCI